MSVDDKAQKLVDRALFDTQVRHPGCTPGTTTHPERKWIDGVVDPLLLAQVGVLRREQTWEERDIARWAAVDAWPGGTFELFTGATRIATAADGSRFIVTVGLTDQNMFEMSSGYERCAAWRRRHLVRMLATKPRKLRRRALQLDAKLTRYARPRPLPPTTVSIKPEAQRFPASAIFEPDRFRREGVYMTALDGNEFFGLVPDGVSTVTAHFERKRAVRSARVQDNVFAIEAPATGEPYPIRIEWRAADGTIERVITPELFFVDFGP